MKTNSVVAFVTGAAILTVLSSTFYYSLAHDDDSTPIVEPLVNQFD